MPTYVYECKSCARQTELVQKVSDPPLKKCPECGGPVKKLLFPVGIVFKGSGFYVTDYKHKEEKRANGSSERGPGPSSAESAQSKPPAPASDSSSDSTAKPASAPAPASASDKS